LGGMALLAWGYMAVLLWRERQSRRDFFLAVALIPLVVAAVNAAGIDHGVSWNDFVRHFHEGAREPTLLRRVLAYVAAAGFVAFAGTLLLVFLLLPGFGILELVRTIARSLPGLGSERLVTPHRLRGVAATYACTIFLLGATDGYMAAYHFLVPEGVSEIARRSPSLALITHLLVIAGVPVLCWQWAKYVDRHSGVDPAEARRLLAAFADLYQRGDLNTRSEAALPASKVRIKQAIKLLLPLAIAEGDTERVQALRLAYGLLAQFTDEPGSELAEGLQLQVEWDALVGRNSTASAELSARLRDRASG